MLCFSRRIFLFIYIYIFREQGIFHDEWWKIELCVQFFWNAIRFFFFFWIDWYINFWNGKIQIFSKQSFRLVNELGILRVHLIRLKNKNENLQESKKTRIRTLVNLVASESFAHYANKTFQVRFFLLCVFISSLLDICTKTGLCIISISFIFFFLNFHITNFIFS